MRICAISDVHFKYHPSTAEDYQNQELILSFLEQAVHRYELLVMVGDIFDLWFDGRYTIIKQYYPLLRKLSALKDSGCRLILISGNHDFWFGDFLPDTVGIEIYPEQFCFETDGQKMLFCHGDTHTSNDFRYQALRKILRFPLIRKLFTLFHPDLALSLGNRFSRSSRRRIFHPRVRDRKISGLVAYASSRIKKGHSDIVVMGHSHKPQIMDIGTGFYLNCGDWIKHYSYVEILDGIPSLKYFITDPAEQESVKYNAENIVYI